MHLEKKSMAENFILDSFALLAFYQKEQGAKEVKRILKQAESSAVKIFLSEISLGEIYYIVLRELGPQQAKLLLASILALPVEPFLPKRENILRAAELKALGKISYADCFVLELAEREKGTIITGDREFKAFEKMVNILWL